MSCEQVGPVPGPTAAGTGAGMLGKRVVDVTVGSVLALLALPVIALLAVAVAARLRTWPLFTQKRPGYLGRDFTIVKLRTLPPSAPRYASKFDADIAGLRLPALCRLLRTTHLDELPQLLLVPFGTMSLVGPRPRLPDHVEAVDPDFDRLRSLVRPGCTGLWQVGTASQLVASGAPAFDLFYLRHAGLRLDLWIMLRTVALVARLARPVEVHEVPLWARGRGLVPDAATLSTRTAPARPVSMVGFTHLVIDAAPAAQVTAD